MQEQTQVDNSQISDSIFDSSDDFFAALDTEINRDILDNVGEVVDNQETVETSQPTLAAEKQVTSQRTGGPDSNSEHNYKKRYTDSSKEARRLNTRLTELAPVNIKEKLGLDEDFIFDADEAVSDPSSGSAKVLQTTVDGIVQRRLSQQAKVQTADAKRAAEESSFRSRHNVSDTDFNDLLDYAKNNKLTLDDIYYLKNRESKEDNIAKSAQTEVIEQMKNVRKTPKSASATGGESSSDSEITADEKVFNWIKGSESSMDGLLG